MKKSTRYVFGAALAGTALSGVPGILSRASASVITAADFTFETSATLDYNGSTQPLSSSITGATIGPLIAEVGTGSAYGSHASASTVYSSPSGNGSTHSFSANVWAAGDMYKFLVPTTGLNNIVVSYDQISSSTGPKTFEFLASPDSAASDFSTIGTYTLVLTQVATSVGGTATETESTWNPTYSGAYGQTFNLAAFTSLNNDPNAIFEIVEDDTTTATAGTDRIDNVIVSGSTVPEPAELSLLTLAAAGLLLRRRQ